MRLKGVVEVVGAKDVVVVIVVLVHVGVLYVAITFGFVWEGLSLHAVSEVCVSMPVSN